MAGCSNIEPPGLAEGGDPTPRTMSTSTKQRPNSARNLTWQPTQGIVFATPSASQKDPYSTKSNKRGTQGASNTNNKFSISTTASQSPESSNRALPVALSILRETVSQPLPDPSTPHDIPVKSYGGIYSPDYGGIYSPDYAELGRLLWRAKQQKSRQIPGVEGQPRNDTSILFEDGSGSDAEEPIESAGTSRGQQRGTRLAVSEDRKLKHKEMGRRGVRLSWEEETKTKSQKIIAEQASLEEKADVISEIVESMKRTQKMLANCEAMKKRQADKEARNVEALQKAKKEKDDQKRRNVKALQKAKKVKEEEKRRNAEAEQKAVKEPQPQKQEMRLKSPAIAQNLLFDVHTPGFASTGGKHGRASVALDTQGPLHDFSKLKSGTGHKEILETEMWQRAKLELETAKRNEGDKCRSPEQSSGNLDTSVAQSCQGYEEDLFSLTNEYIRIKLPFISVDRGFHNILDATALLAREMRCSQHVRTLCADMYDEVKMLQKEISRVGHSFRAAHRLRLDLRRFYSLTDAEQALSRDALTWSIRRHYVEVPFWEYARLMRETDLAFDMFIESMLRRHRKVFIALRENWLRYFARGYFETSVRDCLDTIRNRDAAAFGWKANVVSFRNYDKSMSNTDQSITELCDYWHKQGLVLYVPSTVTDGTRLDAGVLFLQKLRETLMSRCHEMQRRNYILRTLLRMCENAVQRRPDSLSLATTCLVGISDYEDKDFSEANSSWGQSSSSGGTLGFRPTHKLDSQCSAVAVEDESEWSDSGDAEAPADVIDHTSMVYQIPGEVLREAMLASQSTGAAYWQYSLYQEGGDPSGEKVKVHYCTSKETTQRIAQLFLDKEVIGFDIEWKPQAQVGEGIKKNVSLIQIASEERIALFHIARYAKGDTIDDLLAPSLKEIMESSEISKVGVSVKADCTRLRRFLGIEARGLFELSHLYKLIKHSAGDVKKINKLLVSLAQQVEEHLQLPMWKGDVRSSDWSQKLNYEQIKYAASDSYAGLRLYDVMEGKRKTLKPTPPRPAHAELNLPIILANGKTVATYDEPDELKDEKPTEDVNGHPADVEEMARDFLDIELEDSEIKPSSTSRSAARGSKKSPEFTAAETWVTNWRSKQTPGYKPRAMPSQLRAYALWSELGKDVSEVAEILRDPPLQATTVANYISEAIRLEKLPFQDHRLEKVWAFLPARVPGRGWRPQGSK